MTRNFLSIVLALAMFAGCALFAPRDPSDKISRWSDITLIFDRLIGQVGEQPDFQRARGTFADPDDNGEFNVATLYFLIEPREWAEPYPYPLALYVGMVGQAPELSEAGKRARILAAEQIRDSLIGIKGGAPITPEAR